MARPKNLATTRQKPIVIEAADAAVNPLWAPVYCTQHHWEIIKTGVPCACPPGPQYRAMLAVVDEELLGGARMGGKSDLGRGLLLRGNPRQPVDHPEGNKHVNVTVNGVTFCPYCVNASYVAHPRYRALILRQNEKDLSDWADRAIEFYTQLGVKVTTKPLEFTWPSGAIFRCGHLRDSNAYTDYQGHEYHTILVEELTQIPAEKLYLQIKASCRSTFQCRCGKFSAEECICGCLRPTMIGSTNPGEVGHAWVRKRFVDVGPPNVPWKNPATGQTRIFIPMTVDDNPYADASYAAQLDELRFVDPSKWRAWRYGDWDCLSGGYFTNFRPRGPILGAEPPEPDWADHVIRGNYPHLDYYWPRFIGLDWGYVHRTVALWACKNQRDRRLHVYRELSIKECGAEDIGVRIAQMSLPELQADPDNHIPIYLSHDAFSQKDGRRTIAEQIRDGINLVLGANAVFMAKMTDDERRIEEEFGTGVALAAMKRRFTTSSSKYVLSLHESTRLRVDGWQKIRELLRFQPHDVPPPDEAFIARLRDEANGEVRVHEYLRSYEEGKAKVTAGPFPSILFWDCCKDVIQELIDAVYDEGTEDILEDGQSHSMDALDALRYLVMGYLDEARKLPRREAIDNRMRDFAALHPGRAADPFARQMVAMKAAKDFPEVQRIQFLNLGRASSRYHHTTQ